MITLSFAAWWIPLGITILALFVALYVVDGGNGMFSGLANVIALVPALAISCLAWIVYAIFK
jgi:hypothetical protein